MSREQLSLGDEGIAEELAQGQRAISIAEFFEKNKQMLGFDSGARALVTAVKEGVDNSLDATEEADILPDIYVEIEEVGDYYRVVIEDNGPGITKNQIPKIFGKLLYGSRFHVRSQSRGQQGIGISAAVLYSQLTSGKPVKITSRTMGGDGAQYFEVAIDTEANEPEIETEETTTWDRPHGTRIEMEMEANLRARQRLLDYIEYTAVVNPHARIEFREPKSHRKFERATDQLPDDTEEIRPHPHGVELGTLQKMLDATDSYSVSGFLQNEFTRVGGTTAANVIDNFRDRHVGRELSWRPPGSRVAVPSASDDDGDGADSGDGDDGDGEDSVTGDDGGGGHEDPERAIADAVANKGREPTDSFARRVADDLDAADRLAHHDVVAIVDAAADDVQEEYEVTFGSTVRENAVAAAWSAVTADRAADLYRLVDDATTSRKDDADVRGLAERIAAKFENAEDDRDRVTRGELREYVDRAADMAEEHGDATFGETARENVLEALWAVARQVPEDPPKVRTIADDRDLAAALLEAMRETDILAPPTDCLSPITAELVEAGLKKEYDADFYAAATRDAEVHSGDPFVVEAGIAYGGELEEDGQVDILRFANRVSLVYKRGGCAITHVIKDINWRNYGLDQPGGSGIPNGPAVLLVHVASTNVPFTSESKDAVADIPEIEDEIELALREAARELKSYLNRRRSMEKRRRKRDQLATILPEMAEKLAEVTGRDQLDIDDSLARIMNNVLVDRELADGTVRLTVENNTDTNVELELTDIVSAEPATGNGASVVEMDGEWFVNWSPTVTSGGEATLEYTVDGDPTFDLSVEGVAEEKLTVAGQ